MRMIRWNVRNRAEKRGVRNAHDLAVKAGLSYPVAYRIWNSEKAGRIDAKTLEHLHVALKTKSPWLLLTFTPGD